jgi:hypothetical protein
MLLSDMKKRILRYKGVSFGFTIFCSLAHANEPLVSTITEDSHTHSNLQRFPRRRNYLSNGDTRWRLDHRTQRCHMYSAHQGEGTFIRLSR